MKANFLEEIDDINELGDLDSTKHRALLEWVQQRLDWAKEGMRENHDNWQKQYVNYRGTRIATKEAWQSNIVIPVFKEIVRIKVPLYMNILFSNNLESFDILPGEEEDEQGAPLVKTILAYQQRQVARDLDGFYGQWDAYCKQFEMYGYTVGYCPWKMEYDEDGKLIFDGPDFEVLDITAFYPDPANRSLNSWKFIEHRDIEVSYLKRQEAGGFFHDIYKLRGTSQPDKENIIAGIDLSLESPDGLDPRVELIEYHGEVPKSLLEGELDEISDIDPYEDEYVKAIVTIANREVIIRAVKDKHKCNIFFCSSKDKMVNEQVGVGTGEDIEAMARELTNLHNKFNDAVNIICNPMLIINPTFLSSLSGTLVSYPGKVFIANAMVEDVRKAISFIDTTAAASALQPIMLNINFIDQRIQKLSQAVPAISPAPTSKEMHETLGGTQIQQANAAEPIKDVVRHILEPAYTKMLNIFYKLDTQFFSKASAYRILGKKKAQDWYALTKKKDITRDDLTLFGDPDFIARGVSVFQEKQVEMQNLLKFFELVIQAKEPMIDPGTGQPVTGQDGQPVMEPIGDIAEVIKRCGVALNFKDVEKLIPKIYEYKEKQRQKSAQADPTSVNTNGSPLTGGMGGAQWRGSV